MEKNLTGAQMLARLDEYQANHGPRRKYKQRRGKLDKYRTEVMEMHNLGAKNVQIQRAARTFFDPPIEVHAATVGRFIKKNLAEERNAFE